MLLSTFNSTLATSSRQRSSIRISVSNANLQSFDLPAFPPAFSHKSSDGCVLIHRNRSFYSFGVPYRLSVSSFLFSFLNMTLLTNLNCFGVDIPDGVRGLFSKHPHIFSPHKLSTYQSRCASHSWYWMTRFLLSYTCDVCRSHLLSAEVWNS